MEVDDDFSPKLSHKTNLENYPKKALDVAHCEYEEGEQQDLKGIVIGYANDKERGYAYISLVAVRKKYRSQGVARKLMLSFIRYASNIEFIKIIGIHTNNPIALKLYQDLGFSVIEDSNNRYYLEFKIR